MPHAAGSQLLHSTIHLGHTISLNDVVPSSPVLRSDPKVREFTVEVEDLTKSHILEKRLPEITPAEGSDSDYVERSGGAGDPTKERRRRLRTSRT